MGSEIDLLSVAGFATLAIAANASYLNLPYFRYRIEISKRASESFKRFQNIDDDALKNLKEYKLLRELSGMKGNHHPAGQNPGQVDRVAWESEEGRIYLTTFHKHKDRRLTTAALWMSGCYLFLLSFSSFTSNMIYASTTSFYIFIVSALVCLSTYFCCDYTHQARFISVVKGKNWKMLVPFGIFSIGLSGLFCGLSFIEFITPDLDFSSANVRLGYIYVAGKLSLFISIIAMIAALYYPMNLIRLGNVIVDKAKDEIDECDANLSPFEDKAKQEIEEKLKEVRPVDG